MALKTYTPTTPGQRQLVMVDRSALYKGKPVKRLTEGKQSSGGRNNTGRMVVRFRGGGHKKAYRIVDFKRTKVDMRSEPPRLYRAGEIHRRQRGLYPGAAASGGRRHRDRRQACRREARQC